MEVKNNIAQQQQNLQVKTEAKETQVEQKTQVESAQLKSDNVQKPLETEKDVSDLVKKLNQSLDPFNTSIRFGFDNSNDVFFVSVIDTSTSDTIRRFPAEQAQTLVGKLNEVTGIIFDEVG
jgi:flagellar protein FlaG